MKNRVLVFLICFVSIVAYGQDFDREILKKNHIGEIYIFKTGGSDSNRTLSNIQYVDTAGLVYKVEGFSKNDSTSELKHSYYQYYKYDSLNRVINYTMISSRFTIEDNYQYLNNDVALTTRKAENDKPELIQKSVKHGNITITIEYADNKVYSKTIAKKTLYGYKWKSFKSDPASMKFSKVYKRYGKVCLDVNRNVLKSSYVSNWENAPDNIGELGMHKFTSIYSYYDNGLIKQFSYYWETVLISCKFYEYK